MPSIQIDRDRCKRDQLCIMDCPTRVITTDVDGFPTLRDAAAKNCIYCGHCIAVCPYAALTLNGTCPEDLEPAAQDEIKLEDTERLLKSRRSVRRFKDRIPDPGLIQRLLDSARYAPSAKNRQPVNWTIIQGPDRVQRLARVVIDWMRQDARFATIVKAWEKGHDNILRQAPLLALAHASSQWSWGREDCVIAVSYLELAAWSAGLGPCWSGYLVDAAKKSPEVHQAAGIPVGRILHAGLMLGYPQLDYYRIPKRARLQVDWQGPD